MIYIYSIYFCIINVKCDGMIMYKFLVIPVELLGQAFS